MTENIPHEIVEHMRDELLETGVTSVQLGNDMVGAGLRVFLIEFSILPSGSVEPGFLLAVPGAGSMFVGMDRRLGRYRPLNKFQLLSAGFSIKLAPTLAELVNRVLMLDKHDAGGHREEARRLLECRKAEEE